MCWKLIVCLSAVAPRDATQSPIASFWRRCSLVRGSGGLLVLLSVLHTSQSAPIKNGQMAELGEAALTYLETEAKSAMRNHSGPHSVGCIEEAKEHEHLNCSLVCTFNSYFQEAAGCLQKKRYKTLVDKLRAIIQTVDDLKTANCSGHSTTCEAAFQDSKETSKNLEMLRSLLVLYRQWIVKPMQ